jgi:hypothetical protein
VRNTKLQAAGIHKKKTAIMLAETGASRRDEQHGQTASNQRNKPEAIGTADLVCQHESGIDIRER